MGGEWPEEAKGLAINELELLALTAAAYQWGPLWARKRLITTCDNMASVICVNKGSVRSAPMMVVMRDLFQAACRHGFQLRAQWISTHLNTAADAISRGDMAKFYTFARDVLRVASPKQVQPVYNVDGAIRRMQKARRGEARRRKLQARHRGGRGACDELFQVVSAAVDSAAA